jgi:hypothetical protein
MVASRMAGMCYNESLSVFGFAVSAPARRSGGICEQGSHSLLAEAVWICLKGDWTF